jgi:DNA-binding CsgD family transcriptional regulator
MASSERVRAADVRGMFRLMGEVAEFAADPLGRKLHVIEGLCRLVDAQVGVATAGRDDGNGPVPYNAVDAGWGGAAERAAMWGAAVTDSWTQDPAVGPMVRLMVALPPGGTVIRRREELVYDLEWYRSPHVGEFRRPARVDHCIYCVYRHHQREHLSGISLHRPWGGRRCFSAREREMVELVWSGLGWLHHAEEPARQPQGQLSPRPQQVFQRLLAGDSAKQAAQALDLSTHTVRDYIKSIYLHYGVCSRAELLAKFVRQ